LLGVQNTRSVSREPIVFHERDSKSLLYVGKRKDGSNQFIAVSYYSSCFIEMIFFFFQKVELSRDGGKTWREIITYVDKCFFSLENQHPDGIIAFTLLISFIFHLSILLFSFLQLFIVFKLQLKLETRL